jgi:hypothetical protein
MLENTKLSMAEESGCPRGFDGIQEVSGSIPLSSTNQNGVLVTFERGGVGSVHAECMRSQQWWGVVQLDPTQTDPSVDVDPFFHAKSERSRVKSEIVAKYFRPWTRVILSTAKRRPDPILA